MTCPHGANCPFCRALDELKAESECESEELRLEITRLENQLTVLERSSDWYRRQAERSAA